MLDQVQEIHRVRTLFTKHHQQGIKDAWESSSTLLLLIFVLGSPLVLPSYLSPCCDKVRLVPGRDMACIVRLLTRTEKNKHSDRKILRLEELCVNPDATPPPRLHRQVMV
ncbi:hypothetical protein EJB05_28577 [Eragrostis curvula]|uniref:Uncharacterized protein n=1 Tax=Eragrostis curvula TaxID=38414 RepID=A0A5J9URS6_9POAL|nr:hypothetical protein EJB05_28577 [Eragrostis curvula]